MGKKWLIKLIKLKSENRPWIPNGEELIAIGKTAPKQHEKKQEKGKRTKQELDWTLT